MDIPMECVCRYILEAKGTVPLVLDTVHDVNYTWIYRWNVFVGIFQRWRELFPFSLTLFMMLITYEHINKIFLSVYSSSDENCSPFSSTVHCVNYTRIYWRNVSVSIYICFWPSDWRDYQRNYRWNVNSNALTINASSDYATRSPTECEFQGVGN
jgi:hypothetical protein